jgi:hypothetical protein
VAEIKGWLEAMEEGRAMPSRHNSRDEEPKLWPGIRLKILLLFFFLLVLPVLGINAGAAGKPSG